MVLCIDAGKYLTSIICYVEKAVVTWEKIILIPAFLKFLKIFTLSN